MKNSRYPGSRGGGCNIRLGIFKHFEHHIFCHGCHGKGAIPFTFKLFIVQKSETVSTINSSLLVLPSANKKQLNDTSGGPML